MGKYEERIAAIGLTRRERNKYRNGVYQTRHLKESLAYKEVELNGKPTHLIIDRGNQTYEKFFRSLVNGFDPEYMEVLVGDYVKFADSMWIVHDADSDTEMYIDGKMYQCNYLLRWQDETGKIIERWTHIQNASSYNSGKDYSRQTTIGTNQLMIYLPIDDDTRKLERDKRVYCDFTDKKIRYKFARVDSVSETFGKGGLLYIIATEDMEHHDADNDELEICDYIAEPEQASSETHSSINYTSDMLYIGGAPLSFEAVFLDANDSPVSGVTAEWNVDADFEVDYTIDGNTITLSCSDKTAIGREVTLKIVNNGLESDLAVLIAG